MTSLQEPPYKTGTWYDEYQRQIPTPEETGRKQGLLTQAAAANIIRAVELGMEPRHAAKLIGIAHSTFSRWMKEAREGHEPYATLFRYIEQAEAQFEEKLVRAWTSQAISNWSTAAAFLARRFPDRWGTNAQTHLTVGDMRNLSDQELLAIVGAEDLLTLLRTQEAHETT